MPFPARMLTHAGETLSLPSWAKRLGIPAETIRSRLDGLGWPVEKALTTPLHKHLSRIGRPSVRQARPAPIPREVEGKAILRWKVAGEGFYRSLGVWQSEEAESAYAEFCAEWFQTHGRPKRTRQRRAAYTLAELCELHLEADTKNRHESTLAYRVLVEHFGDWRHEAFRAKDMLAYLGHLDAAKYSRRTLVGSLCCVRRMLRWAELNEYVPEGTLGRFAVIRGVPRELGKRRPKVVAVHASVVEQTLAHLREPWRTIVKLQRLIGCRSSEILGLRVEELSRSGIVWVWTVPPPRNKNEWRGKVLVYHLGPKAQELLAPLLKHRAGGLVWPQLKHPRKPHDRRTYATTIRKTCKRNKIPHWHPHQLRHLRTQEIRQRYESSEAAAAAIGDTREVIESIYSDPVDSVRRRIALEFG